MFLLRKYSGLQRKHPLPRSPTVLCRGWGSSDSV
jgi:hypothetical protein